MASYKRIARRTVSVIRVRRRPGRRSEAILLAGAFATAAVLGRAGIRANKREGDGATPSGRFGLVRLWWRADRLPRPRSRLAVARIEPALAWCEDPADRRYNRPFRRSAHEGGDRLWREDHLYDLVIELSHNTRPRVTGGGSAVFLHVARPDRAATAGCVALAAIDLRRLLCRVGPQTRIDIRA